MRVIRHLERSRPRFEHPVVTLGVFDGVHVGHAEILRRVVAAASERGGDPVLITFHPHPAVVLAPGREPAPIASLADRLAAFRGAGIRTAIVQRFTKEFSQVEAETFVARTLVGLLGVERVIVGHSVAFGRNRGGNADRLTELGREHGFEVEIVGPIIAGEIEVSSSAVRRLLATADLRGAERLLGRHYGLRGRVVVGKKRGRTIGFPTANLRTRVAPLLPDGVYAVTAVADGAPLRGVANLGTNPTFGDVVGRSLEVHLLDFDGDLYGRRLRVEFVERIRGEQRFASIEALTEQIRRDAARAREILA
ncbi:MAG: bifunctional riboflavin kinase/FAD synthetase [Candidatus Binatia bacterium]